MTLLGGPHTSFAPDFLEVIVQSTNDFFHRYLKSDRDALTRLTRNANVPDVSTLQAAPRAAERD